jgi:hypothetical protein
MRFKGIEAKLRDIEETVGHLPGPPDPARIAEIRERGYVPLIWPNGELRAVWPILKNEEISDRPGGAAPEPEDALRET